MSHGIFWPTAGVAACVYGLGIWITAMSVTALQSASLSTGPDCGASGCMQVASAKRSARNEAPDSTEIILSLFSKL